MKKDLFFFNFNILKPFFLKKAVVLNLPIKYLIRLEKQQLIVLDSFSFFFTFKIKKKKTLPIKNFFIKKPYIRNASKVFQKVCLLKVKRGNFFFLEKSSYLGQSNFKFIFFFYKQFSFIKKIAYLYKFVNQLKILKNFKNKIFFLKKIKLKKGFLKYYLNGLLLLKFIKKHVKIKTNRKMDQFVFLNQPLLSFSKKNSYFSKNQIFFLAIKKMCILTHLFTTIKIYNRKIVGVKLFSKRQKIYKNDFKYLIYLNTKSKRKYLKIHK